MTTTAVQNTQREAQIQAQLQSRRSEYALNIARYLVWAPGFVTLALFIAWLALRQYTQLLAIAGCALLVTIPSALHPSLHRRGQEILGAFLFSIALIIAAGTVPLVLPSTLVTAAVGLGLVIILANQILGDRSRELVIFAGLFLLADFLLVYLWPIHWPTSLNETASWIIAAALSLLAFIVLAAIARTITVGQEDSFAQAQRASYEVEARAAAEQAQREYLQTTVQTCVEFMAEVAQGDLAVRLPSQASADPNDPLVTLGHSLNETVASLQDMGLQIRETAGSLASAAAEILAAATQQASGAAEQSAAIAQASTTIDEVRTIAEQTAQRAKGVADLAQRVAQVARAGQHAITSTITGMDTVKGKVDSIAHDVLALSEQAQAIGSIISTVNQIASQSNMLALNASVEAARAGEAGKGFAVVASEVRSLAQQSKSATEQVREILTEIQRGVNTAVMATEEGIKGADTGVSLTGEAGESIRLLAESVEQSTQAAQQIAAAAGQQQAGMEQIAAAMENIHQVTAESVASTRQVERAAGELSALAGQLRQLVEQYRL